MSAPTGRVIPKIFNEEGGAGQEKGEHARMSAFIGAIAVADLVKSTLGPKGMDKILASVDTSQKGGRGVTVTNDGATILKAIPVDNPAAKILVDISKTQDAEVGDGTTSVVVFAGELLREAERLISQKIHPQTVIRGWRKAVKVAREALEASAVDNSADPEKFRQDLINIANTTLSSKILSNKGSVSTSTSKNLFAELAVDAVLRLKGSTNLDHIQIIKKQGGNLSSSYLEEGFILEKSIGVGQPKRMENARILVANTSMDTDKIKIFGARVRVDSMSKVAAIEKAEKNKMKNKVEKILAHGCNVFINRQLIYNYPEELFADAGVVAIEHADFEGVERLALVLGSEIVSTFDHPELVTLGTCDVVEEIMIGEDKLIRFGGVAKGEACTLVLRGASAHILDEAERSMHDALCILSQTVKTRKTTLGGGSAEMLMSCAVDKLAAETAGKEQLAIEAFARALRGMPTILSDNAGFDSSEIVSQLRAAHTMGNATAGIDMSDGSIGCMRELGITESLQLKSQVLISAHEAAEMILRVDDIIRCAPRQRQQR